MGVVTSLSFDDEALINLSISSYSEATGATFIHKRLGRHGCLASANFARKTNALVVVDLLVGSCICT